MSVQTVVVIDSGTPRNAPAEAMHGFIVLDGTPPPELLRRGREQVRQYGGRVVFGEVTSAEPAAPSAEGDLRFTITLADGRSVTARRVLVATGLRDVLPDVPGLAEHWGHGVVHCPYCHGWEVRDEPIGILATGPASVHHALLFRQLTDDLIYFTRGTELDADARALRRPQHPHHRHPGAGSREQRGRRYRGGTPGRRHTRGPPRPRGRHRDAGPHRGPGRPETADGGPARQHGPPLRLRHGRHHRCAGVWVAGNATDLTAQVGASAAAGALAGSHINALLATADTDAALAVAEGGSAT